MACVVVGLLRRLPCCGGFCALAPPLLFVLLAVVCFVLPHTQRRTHPLSSSSMPNRQSKRTPPPLLLLLRTRRILPVRQRARQRRRELARHEAGDVARRAGALVAVADQEIGVAAPRRRRRLVMAKDDVLCGVLVLCGRVAVCVCRRRVVGGCKSSWQIPPPPALRHSKRAIQSAPFKARRQVATRAPYPKQRKSINLDHKTHLGLDHALLVRVDN